MFALLLSTLLVAQTPVPLVKVEAPKAPAVQELKPLSFFSKKYAYSWDALIPLKAEVDGLKLNTIFFNRREIQSGLLKGAEFGTRAQVEVTNTSSKTRIPNFAVAVFDEEERLLGVAIGGTKLLGVRPGNTETFDLNFSRVLQRLPKGTHFVLSLEFAE
ncbi:MAG: hypothetical protein Q8O00_07025 [Holophaga sp.]|nr:hypothetical protein [Holophaga sp.]